jgi:hypothetical protein
MFTLFDLFRLLAATGGAFALGLAGLDAFGILGCVVGIPIGLVLGAMIGQLPLVACLRWIALRFVRMTDEQLVDELHDPACLTPNILLLELSLASEEKHRRIFGWAALTSAFPELVSRISGYDPTATTAECRDNCKSLLETTEPIDARKQSSFFR